MEINHEYNSLCNVQCKMEIEADESNCEYIPDLVKNEFEEDKPDLICLQTNIDISIDSNILLRESHSDLIEVIKSEDDISLPCSKNVEYKQIGIGEKSNVAEQILNSEHGWLEEDKNDVSDVDSVSENEYLVSEHDSESELSENGESRIDESHNGEDNSRYMFGKNRFRWCRSEVQPVSSTKNQNITKVPLLKSTAQNLGEEADAISVWGLLFTDDMLLHIVEWTNFKIRAVRLKYKHKYLYLKDTDLIELKAFLGLLIFTSIFNSNHENIETIFATDGTGRDIFRAVMSVKRFALLLSTLRFDNLEDRNERKKMDPVAPIGQIFRSFIRNVQSVYELGQSVTVDEMVVNFRGKVRFKMYMPNASSKYGIKIMALADSGSGYLYNAYIYSGKDCDGIGIPEEYKELSKPTQSVVRLVEPIFGTNRNVTADNWFSSIELINVLQKNKLTYVGAMHKNKQEIPRQLLPNRTKKIGSAIYGFCEECTIISYVEKKNKAKILISSMHGRNSTDPITKKPEILSFYNSTKGGVDIIDKNCRKNSSSRRTCRWPLAIFFRILDISVFNSYIFHQCFKGNKKVPLQVFVKNLAEQLVREHLD
ncbi:piggyBac transposable element-derived protein 4-like isoform X2 [Diabrotica virgifera virgifera]|uniref:PiggyBac transposable element-derived protein domain-containing protein n=1 Tax=Diabrotica virgifera virgifera TaxID=50390 RepID=A0ABM5L5N2_DIAVI|nr:piggyBac transposable element-derived protein 4-like isoform X2 [Diabrotica virgifera virgifera]